MIREQTREYSQDALEDIFLYLESIETKYRMAESGRDGSDRTALGIGKQSRSRSQMGQSDQSPEGAGRQPRKLTSVVGGSGQ
jgi:hypothetical protein